MRSPCGMARQGNYLLEQMYFILGMVSRDWTLNNGGKALGLGRATCTIGA
jgi:hypothetical protein